MTVGFSEVFCRNELNTLLRRAGRTVLTAGWVSVLLLGGCNRSEFKLGDVQGIVTMDGKPISGASILFQPEGAVGTVSVSSTDPQGHYRMVFSRKEKGAIVGNHSVTINLWPSESDPNRVMVRIPARYNEKTELKVEVKPGDNVIDFPLTSEPKGK